MTGFSSEVINTRERPLSSDINDLQSLISRDVLDALQYLFSPGAWIGGGSVSAEAPSHAVLGGLTVSGDGNNVQVASGALLQYSSTIVPTPGTYDSRYRLGVLRAATTVTTPSPVSDTWYLLTARMKEVVVETVSRDILNATTGIFEATTVPKKRERQLEFRFEAGTSTNFPLPSDADWRVIAGVFRPAGGGAVSGAHLYDMRLLLQPKSAYSGGPGGNAKSWPGSLRRRSYSTGKFSSSGTQAATKFSTFDVDGELLGQKIWLHGHRGTLQELVAMTSATQDPSAQPSAAAAGAWYYMYVTTFAGVAPVGQAFNWDDSGVVTRDFGRDDARGVFVESTVAPVRSFDGAQGGMVNGGSLHLPAPFNAHVVLAGEAILVGAFRRSQANGFTPANADGPRVNLSLNFQASPGTLGDQLIAGYDDSWPAGDVTVAIPANSYPKSARTMQVRANWSSKRAINVVVGIHGFSTNAVGWIDLGSTPGIEATADGARTKIPLRLPTGATVTQIRAIVDHAVGAPSDLELDFNRADSLGFTLGVVAQPVRFVIANAFVSTTGVRAVALTGSPEVISGDGIYWIDCVGYTFSGTGDRVFGFQIRMTLAEVDLRFCDPSSPDVEITRMMSQGAAPGYGQSGPMQAHFDVNVVSPTDASDRVPSLLIRGGVLNDNLIIFSTGFTEAV